MTRQNHPTRKAPPSVRFAGKVVIVPRGKCRLERVWSPARNQAGLEAAQLQARQTLLKPEEALFVEPPASTAAGHVNIWICEVRDLPDGRGADAIWVPETFLVEPGADGPRLIACKSGFEGQLWDERSLVSSRWWSSAPTEADWRSFIEGTNTSTGLPDRADDSWSDLPPVSEPGWRQNLSLFSLGRDNFMRVFSPLRLAGIAAFLIVIPAGLLAGAEIKTRTLIQKLEATRQPLSDVSLEVELAQKRAFEARAYSDAMAKSGSSTLLVDALSELKTAAETPKSSISFINLADDEIEVRLEGIAPDKVPSIVTRLDKSQLWTEVSGATNRAGEVVVKAKLKARGVAHD
jgi:hypothetical protein